MVNRRFMVYLLRVKINFWHHEQNFHEMISAEGLHTSFVQSFQPRRLSELHLLVKTVEMWLKDYLKMLHLP